MIKCSKCGFDNLPARLFCAQCRTKLDLGQITREYFSQLPINGSHVRQILLSAALFALILLGLAFWPEGITPVNASDPEGAPARRKVMALQKGAAKGQVEFSEKEVNLLFNLLIQENTRRIVGPEKSAELESGYVKIKSNALIIGLGYRIGPWELGPLTVGPFWLTCKATALPKKKKDGLGLTTQNGVLGHLPLPLLGSRMTYAGLRGLFRPFKNARNLLEKLEIIEMKKGRITVSVGK